MAKKVKQSENFCLATLQSHGGRVWSVKLTPDGQRAISGGEHAILNVWDLKAFTKVATLKGHDGPVYSVAMTPDGRRAVSGSWDDTVMVWDLEAMKEVETLAWRGSGVLSVALGADGQRAIVGSSDRKLAVLDLLTMKKVAVLKGHGGSVFSIAVTEDGRRAISGSDDNTLKVWDLTSMTEVATLTGHHGDIASVALAAHGQLAVSGSDDDTLKVWDLEKMKEIATLRGHSDDVAAVAVTADGRRIISGSHDTTLKVWDLDSLKELATFEGHFGRVLSVAVTADGRRAISGAEDGTLKVWDLEAVLQQAKPMRGMVLYRNAKVVLVGDHGVGKTKLRVRLMGQSYTTPTDSTHGRVVQALEKKQADAGQHDKEIRETFLWDLAGQPGYRLVHQLSLSQTSVGLVVFDGRSETDALSGVRYWARALKRASADSKVNLRKFLVEAQIDRMGAPIGRGQIDGLCKEFGFERFLRTSAADGRGIDELAALLRASIDWDALPLISSNEGFEAVTEFFRAQKAKGRLLLTRAEAWAGFADFTTAKLSSALKLLAEYGLRSGTEARKLFDACIGLVEGTGIIRALSFGELLLLQPEKLDAYGAALVNAAKDDAEGWGAILESKAKAGDFVIPQDERIKDAGQEGLLLVAMVEEMVREEIALRETADDGVYLVFPSQATRMNPDMPNPPGRTVVFAFEGPVANVYTTLAVRLSHSGVFAKEQMWKNAAQYITKAGGKCGIFLEEVEDGKGRMTLFFDAKAGEEARLLFEEFVEGHLKKRAIAKTVDRRRVYRCETCDIEIADKAAKLLRERGQKSVDCQVCHLPVSLMDRQERLTTPEIAVERKLEEMEKSADRERDLEAELVAVSGELKMAGIQDWLLGKSGTVAIVFTDIVGAGKKQMKWGDDQFDEVCGVHFERAKKLISELKGCFIKTNGDAVVALFRTAADALDFALALHEDPGDSRFQVRAGIHVGVVNSQGEDVSGAAVSHAARLIEKTKNDSIFVSNRAKEDLDSKKAARFAGLKWTRMEHEIKEGIAVMWEATKPTKPA